MPVIPMSAEDEALLALEGDLLVGHTCKVIGLTDAPPVADLCERISKRVRDVPILTMRLDSTGSRMRWIDDAAFEPADHVVAWRGPAPLSQDGLREAVGQLFRTRLDRSRPLWQIDVLALESGGAALVWRLHHTLADGTTAMRFARRLLWDQDSVTEDRPAGAAADREDDRRRRAHIGRFFAREFARAGSPFDGQIGRHREVAFAQVALPPLHAAAKRLAGATLNDAVLSAVAGGLRDWMEAHHGRIGQVRIKVPVSLHHAGEEVGNADSYFFLDVPLSDHGPAERLRTVHAATATRKAEHDAERMDQLLRELRGVSPRMARLCEQVERSGRAFGLNVSNVPGPREPVTILDVPVRSLHSLAEIAEHHAVRVAAVSLCDQLFLGFCADPTIVPDVASMAAAAEHEAAELIAAE